MAANDLSHSHQVAVWYEEYGPAVFGCVYALLKNRATAEDITQTVFVQLVQEDAATIHSPKAWLITVGRRLAFNWLRDHQREVYPDEETVETSPGVEDQAVYSVIIRRALEVLNPTEQQIFLLHHLDGYKYRELAQVFDLPVGTVKTHCHTAKKKLHRQLTSLQGEESL